MINAVMLFRRNRARILDLGAVYDFWVGQAPLLQQQLDEVLRAQLVQIVSAFDTFIHDCVRIGIVNKFISSGVISNTLKDYPIPFEDLCVINSLPNINDKVMYLDGVIKKVNSKDSYQSPKSVEYALGLIGVSNIWSKVAPSMRMSPQDVKVELANIVNRRNKIAHESDLDALGVSLNPITKTEVERVNAFIYGLVINIFHQIR